MEYLPIQVCSAKWNISKRRIQVLCKEGRIPGARMIGNMWVIPENSERPNDARLKTPIIEKDTDSSCVRKELKKALRILYNTCSERGISISIRKDYVLSIVASVLFSYYTETEISIILLEKIYHDISSSNERINFYQTDIDYIQDLVQKTQDDSELDDILSWSYQYSNKFINDNEYSKTQFFTEKYMIDYLVENIGKIASAKKILDPCVGGGNFLVKCLEEICYAENNLTQKTVIKGCTYLYGYDIDNRITRIAVVNIRLRAMAILHRKNIMFSPDIWDKLCPNIYMSLDGESIQGSLTIDNCKLVNVINNTTIVAKEVLSNADIVLTNPPFASIKGMKQEQKNFLKKHYPRANCDTCVAFIEAIERMLKENGVCGIVSQNAWMHLSSFSNIREWILSKCSINKIVDLGSGAFQDLSGEKSNVSLIIFTNHVADNNIIEIASIKDGKLSEKKEHIVSPLEYIYKNQSEINGPNGFDFSENSLLTELEKQPELYRDIAVPMQGTSTGNAKELVGYFWEHFGNPDWISVSNGGGYSRWQGLNDSVVKWGCDGEYIKAQKGSALRNVKYFPETQLVFSDTGTAGLNVRLLHENQIFIASGPGIRIKRGNAYAHLALLNSRLASYCLRQISPKLTIAAGYIGQLPVNNELSSSVVLEKNARLCVDLKEKMLSFRPNNIEYSDNYILALPHDINKAAWYLFNEDITNELIKLDIESKIDGCIEESYGLSSAAKKALDESIGKCAYDININEEELDLAKLDKYLDKLLDSSCSLRRTKNAKYALGSDGYIEYTSKDLNINPEVLVRKIQDNPYQLSTIINKYKSMLLHNFILFCMGYNTSNGVKVHSINIDSIEDQFFHHFSKVNYTEWIVENFNRIHLDIFKGIPYLIYKNGEILTNDQLVKR